MSTRKLKYWILLTIIVAMGFFTYGRNVILDYALRNKSVSESQLMRFSKTFQKQYVSLVEHTIGEPYRMYFQFYSERPYEIRIIKSNSKGAALIFIPSNTSKYSYQTTDLEIEAAIFPSRKLSEHELSKKILESVLNLVPNHPWVVVKAPNITFESLEFITSGKEWIEVIGEGTVTTKNIVADKVFYPSLTKIKASTLRKSWSAREAKREAQELFKWEFSSVFESSEDFRKYLAYPELKEIAIYIIQNLRENPDYTMFDFDKDFERLHLTAVLKYGVQGNFAKSVYNYLEEKRTLKKKLLGIEYTNNWSYTAYSVIIILLICSFIILLNFLFKLSHGTKFYPLLKELKKLKKIIGPADAISPLFVCWYLDRQRPINIIPMQRLIPWIIALVCAGFIYYIERKLHSSSETQ
jgi:hypothetical protein